MYRQGRRNVSKNLSMVMDMYHIVTGILIVVLAVITFLNPEGNMVLFPLIFFLAAALNLANGIINLLHNRGNKRKLFAGIALFAVGLALLGLSVISAISIWRG